MTFNLVFVVIGLLLVCEIQFGFSIGKDCKVYQEGPCSSQGGMCAKRENCGDDHIVEGLCPKQRKNGVECCFIIIGPNQTEPSELNEKCGTKGAICMTQCNDRVVDHTGLCVDGLRCCILV